MMSEVKSYYFPGVGGEKFYAAHNYEALEQENKELEEEVEYWRRRQGSAMKRLIDCKSEAMLHAHKA